MNPTKEQRSNEVIINKDNLYLPRPFRSELNNGNGTITDYYYDKQKNIYWITREIRLGEIINKDLSQYKS
jgi:hypothetical protein